MSSSRLRPSLRRSSLVDAKKLEEFKALLSDDASAFTDRDLKSVVMIGRKSGNSVIDDNDDSDFDDSYLDSNKSFTKPKVVKINKINSIKNYFKVASSYSSSADTTAAAIVAPEVLVAVAPIVPDNTIADDLNFRRIVFHTLTLMFSILTVSCSKRVIEDQSKTSNSGGGGGGSSNSFINNDETSLGEGYVSCVGGEVVSSVYIGLLALLLELPLNTSDHVVMNKALLNVKSCFEVLTKANYKGTTDPTLQSLCDISLNNYMKRFKKKICKHEDLLKRFNCDLMYTAGTPLIYACLAGNIDLVNIICDAGASALVADIYGDVALTKLLRTCKDVKNDALQSKLEIMRKLLSIGADPNGCAIFDTSESVSPLIYAIRSLDFSMVKMLIAFGADLNMVNKDNQTPLIIACIERRSDIVDLLLNNLPDATSLHLSDTFGESPIRYSCSNGDIEIFQLLLDYGADIASLSSTTYAMSSGSNSSQRKILYNAASRGSLELIRLLILKGAFDFHFFSLDVGLSFTKLNVLHIAIMRGDIELVTLVIDSFIARIYSIKYTVNESSTEASKKEYPWAALHCEAVAKSRNQYEAFVIKRLVNSCDVQGWTSLHFACKHNYHNVSASVSIVKLLLSYGANPDLITNDDGSCPLHVACMVGCKEVVEVLLDCGNNKNSNDTSRYYGYNNSSSSSSNSSSSSGGGGCSTSSSLTTNSYSDTSTGDSISSNTDEVVLPINKITKRGDSCLHLAIKQYKIDVVRTLLKHPAVNPYYANRDNLTPLLQACMSSNSSGTLEIVSLLLQTPDGFATMMIPDPSHCGDYPLHIACRNGDVELVDLLLRYGAPIDQPNAANMTPLQVACDCLFADVVLSLLGNSANNMVVDTLNRTLLLRSRGKYQMAVIMGVRPTWFYSSRIKIDLFDILKYWDILKSMYVLSEIGVHLGFDFYLLHEFLYG